MPTAGVALYGVQAAEPKWFMVLRIVERHVGTLLAVLFFPLSFDLALLCLISYGVRILGADAIYHRYFAHRTYRVGRITQFVLALIGTQSGQRGPLWWALTHRDHHKHVETALDPHSPITHAIPHAAFGWFVARENAETDFDRIADFAKYPELRWLNRYYWLPFYGVGVLMYAAGALGLFGDQVTGFAAFLWGFEVPATLLLYMAAAINVLGHLPKVPGGYRRYETPDQSENRFLLGLISCGVGFHNNHHRFATCARCGFAWWEIDISFFFIRALERFGLAWNVSRVPNSVLVEGRLRPRVERE
jgi:stearoyl-CoA desaturase (Delta-9 desaturase)